MIFKSRDKESVKWLVSNGRKMIFPTVILTIATMINACTGVIFALFSRDLINTAVAKNWDGLVFSFVKICVLVVAFLALRVITSFLREYISARLEITYKNTLFEKIMKKDYSLISCYHSGDLMNRLTTDVTVMAAEAMSFFPSVGALVAQMISALIVIFAIDAFFALVFVIAGLFVFLFSRVFKKYSKKLYKQLQDTDGKTRSFLQESIENMLVIKAFSEEKQISEKALELQENNYKIRVKRRRLGIVTSTGMSFVMEAGFIYALTWGAVGIFNGMDFGTVTAITQLVSQVQAPFSGLSAILSKWFNLTAATERVMDICNLADENPEGRQLSDEETDSVYKSLKSISFDNIYFRYDRNSVLEDASLKIDKGDFVCIMGISGIGKSTLMKLLLGVYKCERGNISLNLENEKKLEADCYTRPLFSYVPQGNMLLSGTIRENISFMRENVTDDDINKAILLSCCDEFINEFPQGLDTLIGEKGMGLSEGQTQRIAIARALVTKAPVILLDEATSALDEKTELKLLNNLKQLNNMTCIIISHKKAALNICNRHIAIVDKKIVEINTPKH
ncbi:MAG: ABC transporter ATP-binding protein/permease [Clostridiales bacterium]|nr:ABC transporter ATP-binding protein/permease [Clostridiales bacterium]